MTYLYDGSFEGLLTAVFYVYQEKRLQASLWSRSNDQQPLDQLREVAPEEEKARRVLEGCRKKVSRDFCNQLYLLYLADTPQSGNIILQYIIDGLRYGPSVSQRLQLPSVHNAFVLRNKVTAETHRFKGLVRFRKFRQVFLADIEPDHNILPILHPHFGRRLPGENWLIRDTKRKYAAIHFERATQLAAYEDAEVPVEISDEYEEIWREFYRAIAIKERTNPRLQKNYMPKRYWKNLVETWQA